MYLVTDLEFQAEFQTSVHQRRYGCVCIVHFHNDVWRVPVLSRSVSRTADQSLLTLPHVNRAALN